MKLVGEYKKFFKTPIQITTITEEEVIFSNGFVLSFNHYPDCCEWNYADFSVLRQNREVHKPFQWLTIEIYDENGFRLNGIFIPCYSKQSGYYSADLDIIFKNENEETIFSSNIEEVGQA